MPAREVGETINPSPAAFAKEKPERALEAVYAAIREKVYSLGNA
jgi:hypothetical protein